jgi:outer membrane protein
MDKRSRFSFLLLAGLFLSCQSNAQQIYPVSAKDAVDLAFKNVTSLKNVKLDYDIAVARNREITSAAFPQVTGSLQGNHYFSVPLIQFPDATKISVYDVLKTEGVKDGNGNPITKSGDLLVQKFSFFSPWNVNFGASVQQLLFEPQVFVGLLARKALLESSGLQIKVEEDKVRADVYKSYYAVLITEKQLVYIKESRKRLEKLAHDMDLMYKSGFAEHLDIDKANVSVNNIRSAETQLTNGVQIGYASLKMVLGIRQTDSLVLKDSLSSEQVKQSLLESSFNYEDRNEIKLLNKAKELQGYDIKRYKLSYFPTIAAAYNLQRTGQRSSAASNASQQPWFWYTTNLLGLSVNIPIFDGGTKRFKIQQSKFTLQKVENTLDMTKKAIDFEQSVSRITLSNALINLNVQENNMELAQRVYDTEKKKYEAGLGSSFAILQSDTELQQAQSNYFKSLYDAVVARIDFLKSLGKL